jgi:hypothetical protein
LIIHAGVDDRKANRRGTSVKESLVALSKWRSNNPFKPIRDIEYIRAFGPMISSFITKNGGKKVTCSGF